MALWSRRHNAQVDSDSVLGAVPMARLNDDAQCRSSRVHHQEDCEMKAKKPGDRRWSGPVSRESDALTLEPGVFTKRSPRAIALSLKRSADRSRRRKSSPSARRCRC